MADDDEDRPDDDDDPPEADDATAEDDDPSVAAPDREAVARYLATKEARALARAVLRKIVPSQEVEDLANEAIERAWRARPPTDPEKVPAWLGQIARRRGARWLDKRRRRSKYEGNMPVHEVGEDAYTGEAHEDHGPPDASHDPRAEAPAAATLGEDLDRLVGDHVADRDTREMLRQHTEDGKTYADIARERGLTEAQVNNRILRFKKKYAPRLQRRRERLVWLAKLAALVALAIGVPLLLWWLFHRTQDIRPDPSTLPSARPSASASATVEPFMPAESTSGTKGPAPKP